MSSITTRVTSATNATNKGAPLTNAEIDANFINLNNDKLELSNTTSSNTPDTVVKRDSSGNFSTNQINVASIVTGTVTYPTTNATQVQMESGVDTTTRYMSPNSVKQAIDVLAMQTVGETTKDMTGFPTIAGSTLAYVDATRVFSITPSGTVSGFSKTFSVTTAGMKYYIDGVQQATLELYEGGIYTFDQSDSSNTGHPLRFSSTNNGVHSGGVEYTTGVTTFGTPGTAGAYTRIVVPSGAPTLYYYCTVHSNMGGSATTPQAYFVWYRGKRTAITSALTISLSANAGNHYVYINPTTMLLEETMTFSDTLFTDNIIVASIYLDTATTKALVVGDERHSSARDTTWHANQHQTLGAIWRSGGAVTYTLNSDTATTLSFVTPIYLADEDLVHTITHASSPNGYFQQVLNGTATINTLYLNGATYSQKAEASIPWAAGSSTAQYNPIVSNSGSLADAGENKYINYWIVATNDINRPIKAIMGRVAYSVQTDAYNESFQDYGLPFAEFAPMYQFTLLTAGTFAGNKVKIVNVKTITQRQAASNQNFKSVSHSELSQLTTSDDHSQYVHISNARTVSAANTYSGNNTFQGTQAFNILTATNIGSSLVPSAGSTYDLGSTTYAWRHVYTSDLHLSNEKHESGNVVDGTRGNWTVQEGETDLYLINNKNGKRYKFSLEEV